MPSNANDVAAAVLEDLGPVEAMQLQKLVYYSQAWHLALTDEPLFPDTVQAWRDGPVIPTLWNQHRGRRAVTRWATGNPERLTSGARKIVDLVCQVYGPLSGDDLSHLAHSESPWRTARNGIPDDQPSREVIPTDSMKAFYRRRDLAHRTVADLAAGGLHGLQRSDLDPADRRETFARIRDSFRRPPAEEHEIAANVGDSAFESAFTVRRHQGRPAQPRVAARIRRERPKRGPSAS